MPAQQSATTRYSGLGLPGARLQPRVAAGLALQAAFASSAITEASGTVALGLQAAFTPASPYRTTLLALQAAFSTTARAFDAGELDAAEPRHLRPVAHGMQDVTEALQRIDRKWEMENAYTLTHRDGVTVGEMLDDILARLNAHLGSP